MTSGTTHQAPLAERDTGMHLVTWIASMIGLLAAAIGAWIMLAPEDGTIAVLGNTWAASDLTEAWGPWLLIGGGAATAIGMSIAAIRDRQHDASPWLVGAEVLLAVLGIAAIVFGIASLV